MEEREMKKKVAIILVLILALSLSLNGCASKPAEPAPAPAADVLKIVLILNGTLGDKSFFDSAANGMTLIKEKYGDAVEVKTIEMSYDQTKWQPTLVDVSEGDYDIIVLGTWQMTDALTALAPTYPDKKYIIFDTSVDYTKADLSNVYSITYKQNEGSFLAGALAASVTKSSLPLANADKKIGFLGGMDIPVINDFLVGYIEGALYVDKDTKVAVSYIGSFDDSAKGKEMALAQYNQGADIGFNVAGQAGLGQLDAAKDAGKYAIGVDSDQAAIFTSTDPAKSALILSSVLKRVDESILRAIDMHIAGTAKYGEAENLGFAEKAIGIVKNDNYEAIVPAEIKTLLTDLEAKIISGEIKVGTSFTMDTAAMEALRNSVK
jgi:basic membrane protein A